MIITINIPCGNTTHPATLEVKEYEKSVVIDSECAQKYGRFFGMMSPCANYVKNNQFETIKLIIKELAPNKRNNQETIQKLTELIELLDREYFIIRAIRQLARFEQNAIPALHKILTMYNIEKQQQAAKAIRKIQKRKQIQIPKETEYILILQDAIQRRDSRTIQKILETITTHQIYDAVPTIFMAIEEENKSKKALIEAYLQLETNPLEKALHFYKTGTDRHKEAALLILETIDPPELLNIALDAVNDFGALGIIASRIIKNKATKEHLDKLIETINKAEYTTTIECIGETIIKLYQTEAQQIFINYIKNNPNIQDWKKRRIIKYIAKSDTQRYKTNPTRVFQDFNPDIAELAEFLEGLQTNTFHSEKTIEKIIKTITIKLENDPPQDYDPFSIRYLLKRYT